MANDYSARWFAIFAETIDPAQTQSEVEFIQRQLPLPSFRRVLDVCCGNGRHAIALARRGYEVLGIDNKPEIIKSARGQASSSATFLVQDMRRITELPQEFDAAICMWQSFGHFDGATNIAVLRQIAERLRVGGRFILDLYNRDFFAQRQGTQGVERDGRCITETKRIVGDRLSVRLDYGDGRDEFEWQIFTLAEIRALAERCGLRLNLACCNFDASLAPRDDVPRMQLAFERMAAIQP